MSVWYRSHEDVFIQGSKNFYVARQAGKGYQFSSHDDPLTFWRSIAKLKAPAFHELVPEWRARKIHFDIDIDKRIDCSRFITLLLEACAKILESQNIPLEPESILVLDASDSKKTSIHVILSNIVTESPEESRSFATAVTTELEMVPIADALVRYVDMGIYQRNRCFRLPHCTKRGQSRYLVPIPFSYGGVTIDHTQLEKEVTFLMGVLGVLDTSECHVVRYKRSASEYTPSNVQFTDQGAAVIAYVKANLLPGEFQFEVEKIERDSVHLRRTGSGPCRVCTRSHDRLGALLTLTAAGDVLYRCWGAPHDPYLVGKLGTEVTSEVVRAIASHHYIDLGTPPDSCMEASDAIVRLVATYGYIE